MPIGAALGPLLGAGSALIGASSAKKAAKAQTQAAQQDMAFQTQTRDQIVSKLDPYYQGGTAAQAALMYEAGLGPRPMIGAQPLSVEEVRTPMQGQSAPRQQGYSQVNDPFKNPFGVGQLPAGSQQPARAAPQMSTSYRVGGQTFGSRGEAEAYAAANGTQGTAYEKYAAPAFQESPGYQFAFNQGTDAVNALAGAKGGLNSGRTLQDLNTFGQGIANQEYGNWWNRADKEKTDYFNRLAGLSGSGQNAAAQQGTAMTNAAAGVSQAYGNIGNAQSAGAIGVSNALNSGIQNYIGYQQYQQGLGNQAPASNVFTSSMGGQRNGIGTPGITPGLFGGGR